ncbi:hypothetical protein EXN66_Car019170 [Channa argus]|uniref:Uncharacterized protein n=1 Tax=Channa argus TaxID=215402 RepID=A0A6G1QLN9_CHAAH|nr:hypothetical protein EXN66_Car019170 [Channa argus]
MSTHTKPKDSVCVCMGTDKITDLKVQLAPVQPRFSLNYSFMLWFGFWVCFKVCFLTQKAGKTSLILDEQHHLAVQS